nr:homoprotocatechuate degradation operon regulator HpaR [Methylobacterium nonmethylotrophicum]
MSLLRAREAVMQHFRASLRHHNLTEQQWRVLRALTTVEAIETTELAYATFLLPPSLSRIVRDLEERGLVARRSAETDLRRALVSISQEGMRVIETVSPESELIYGRIADAFGSERLALLQDLLRELEICLTDLPGGADAAGSEAGAPAPGSRRE